MANEIMKKYPHVITPNIVPHLEEGSEVTYILGDDPAEAKKLQDYLKVYAHKRQAKIETATLTLKNTKTGTLFEAVTVKLLKQGRPVERVRDHKGASVLRLMQGFAA